MKHMRASRKLWVFDFEYEFLGGKYPPDFYVDGELVCTSSMFYGRWRQALRIAKKYRRDGYDVRMRRLIY